MFGAGWNADTWLQDLNDRTRTEAMGWIRALHKHQLPPMVAWRCWLLLGGRGSGKTLAGGTWVAKVAAARPGMRLALVGPTLHDVREVMVEGPSGVLALCPGWDWPRWEAGRKRLVWGNGSLAYGFSAEDPDSLRGPQFHGAWADEFCAWRDPDAVLSNLRLAMRLGQMPKLMVTTTPRPIPALRRLMAEGGTHVWRAATRTNAEHLSPGFLENLKDLYGGTRLEAQELEGLVVENDGALFSAADLARARGNRPPALDRIVVAVDPPVSAHGDACGIVVAGRRDRVGYVLADHSCRGLSPHGWARRVAETATGFSAHQIVAEANQGGEMVRAVLVQAGCPVPIKLVHASRGKRIRAEPIAALYEQGRVVHCDAFPALEEEMMALGADTGGHSPDRADALVWALSHLMLGGHDGPRIRVL